MGPASFWNAASRTRDGIASVALSKLCGGASSLRFCRRMERARALHLVPESGRLLRTLDVNPRVAAIDGAPLSLIPRSTGRLPPPLQSRRPCDAFALACDCSPSLLLSKQKRPVDCLRVLPASDR